MNKKNILFFKKKFIKLIILFIIFLFNVILSSVTAFSQPRFTNLSAGELSISIDTNTAVIDIGSVYTSSTSKNQMIIENNGSNPIDFKLSLTNPAGWSAVNSSVIRPGLNEYRLYGIFSNKNNIPEISYFENNDLITTIDVVSSSGVFSMDSDTVYENSGWGIAPKEKRNLFFKFEAPELLPKTTTQIEIMVTITAVPASYISLASSIGVTGGTLSIPDGTKITFPTGALNSDAIIQIEKLSNADPNLKPGSGIADNDKPISVYSFKPDGLVFKKPVEVSFVYDEDIAKNAGIIESKLRVFWYDNFDWVIVGGVVDTEKNIVTIKINHFSIYAIFPALQLSDNDYRPKEKIITPVLIDNKFDFAYFNGLQGKNFEINIFDITGKQIRKITQDNPNGPVWNGKDENSDIVESGVYLYQLKIEGKDKIISGTIVVAK